MTSIITGDIIKSQRTAPSVWLNALKASLSRLEPIEKHWEIFRGDSFQIEIKDPKQSFEAAMYIKACIKTIKGLDVRLAIGIGEKTYQGESVTESNGEVFQFSGDTLETLKKKKVNLKIKTSNNRINDELNLYFRLGLIPMDGWSQNSAETVKLHLENPTMIQKDIAELIGTTQNAISKRQKRANLDVLLELNQMYKRKITQEL